MYLRNVNQGKEKSCQYPTFESDILRKQAFFEGRRTEKEGSHSHKNDFPSIFSN